MGILYYGGYLVTQGKLTGGALVTFVLQESELSTVVRVSFVTGPALGLGAETPLAWKPREEWRPFLKMFPSSHSARFLCLLGSPFFLPLRAKSCRFIRKGFWVYGPDTPNQALGNFGTHKFKRTHEAWRCFVLLRQQWQLSSAEGWWWELDSEKGSQHLGVGFKNRYEENYPRLSHSPPG